MSVGTADEPPVPFGALSQDVLAQIGAKARHVLTRLAFNSHPAWSHGRALMRELDVFVCLAREGYLVKFIVGPGGILMADGRPAAADLAIEGAAARRGDADTLNKVRKGGAGSLAARQMLERCC